MRPRLFRAALIIAVYTLLASLSAASIYIGYLESVAQQPAAQKAAPQAADPQKTAPQPSVPPSPPVGAFWLIFFRNFRYFMVWALAAPGVLWLWRRMPITRERWAGPLAFHAVMPVVIGVPVEVVGMWARKGSLPVEALLAEWKTLLAWDIVAAAPVYWLLLGLGAAHQLYRDYQARQIASIVLQRGLEAARLDALRMQLQPHFLFNTLNSITCLAREGDTDAVMRVVEHLGTLLRLSMESSGRQFVSLAEEAALLRSYLAIEEIRFSDRLSVVVSIDDDVLHVPVPNLLLMPLVENALVHGIARRIGGGRLEVTAAFVWEKLVLTVEDDGPGLPSDWTMATAVAGRGQGIRHVAERLEALYPGAWQFEVSNRRPGGTMARIRIPAAPVPVVHVLE
jgi:two-component system, LytTR family, sensor kinase